MREKKTVAVFHRKKESTLTINNENPPYQICSVHNPVADTKQNYLKDGSENEKEYIRFKFEDTRFQMIVVGKLF